MQYILSEKEMKYGHELLLAWTIENVKFDDLYDKVKNLISQGFYPHIIPNTLPNKLDIFTIEVFQLND